ncbi:MAG: hypothetical protein KIT56_05995 [Gammaproteobacteria bacterium]|nr:hypothetical protein [Gammaproteobacteria bacterium]MCW5583421.1 hypothetical protein [Gammaproteobacteria bacterium]
MAKHDKSDLFDVLKELPNKKQIPLLRQCLDKNTVLGERFWKQEGVHACSKERGTLKKIQDQLSYLEGSMPRIVDTKSFHLTIFRTKNQLTPERAELIAIHNKL